MGMSTAHTATPDEPKFKVVEFGSKWAILDTDNYTFHHKNCEQGFAEAVCAEWNSDWSSHAKAGAK
jgi:hypothetical protein